MDFTRRNAAARAAWWKRGLRFLVPIMLGVALASCSTSETLRTVKPQTVALSDAPRYAAILIDANTGGVLYAVNETDPRYPASLTKMMTLYMLFEAMAQGKVTPATEIPVSAYAATRPPSKLGLKAGETIPVDTAIRALAVRSANDVAAAIAEFLGGTEERFALMMTEKTRLLGMRNTVFRNASGLPDAQQVTTARDMAMLGLALRRTFPQYYSYFELREFSFRGNTVRGHNRVLDMVAGADGIKTGYVRASGFNLATSVNYGGKRVVAVVMGFDRARDRDEHMAMLIERFMPSVTRR